MPNRKADITALFEHAQKQFAEIKTEYEGSLRAKSISAGLKIGIKNFCENLRSAMDYLAHEIYDVHCGGVNSKTRFYFPILPDRAQFADRMKEWFHDLEKSSPKIWSYLESIQPYSGVNTQWLGLFNRLNNENKHDALVHQDRVETEEIRVTSDGGSRVSWNPSSVTFGRGVFIGGVPVDPHTQLPVPHSSQKVERITWVDFRFDGINISALSLLKEALDGTVSISDNIFKLLDKS